jgi:hypothetical protein
LALPAHKLSHAADLCSVERRANDLVQKVEHLIGKHVGIGRTDAGCSQRRGAVLTDQAVEVGEVNNEKPSQTSELADQVAAAGPGGRREGVMPMLVQCFGDGYASCGDKFANTVFESIA